MKTKFLDILFSFFFPLLVVCFWYVWMLVQTNSKHFSGSFWIVNYYVISLFGCFWSFVCSFALISPLLLVRLKPQGTFYFIIYCFGSLIPDHWCVLIFKQFRGICFNSVTSYSIWSNQANQTVCIPSCFHSLINLYTTG